MSTTKVCSKCGAEKPATIEHFRKHYGGLRGSCKECDAAYQREYRRNNQERVAAYQARYRAEHKDHRKALGSSSLPLYRWLVKNGFPAGFQVLCRNCNWGKHANDGVCPHIIQGGME
jgi:ribosomal protein L40E